MAHQINDIIIFRFLEKETSEEENHEIRDWVSASEDNKDEFRKLHQFHRLYKDNRLKSEIDVDLAWTKLDKLLVKGTIRRKKLRLNFLVRIAASLLIMISVSLGSIWVNDHVFNQVLPLMVKIEAPRGEKSMVVLSDGSSVWLNSQTVLKYDAMKPRLVSVEGEAYFEIKKDRDHPFEVNTPSGMKVVVTGTRFDVKCYKEESFAEVTLEEGEVRIVGINSEKLAVLRPGQQAKYDIKSKDLQVKDVSAEIYSLWKNDELRFSNITFRELIPRIERWYGISIALDQEVGKKDRFTMTIKTESLRELLNMMQLTSKFKYEINGSLVEIRSK